MAFLKRSAGPASNAVIRRIKPNVIADASLKVNNLVDGETLHQSSVLVTGESLEFAADDHISVTTHDVLNNLSSTQHWPIVDGQWKALVLLSCGANELKFEHRDSNKGVKSITLAVSYQPLLQLPPLHLAILIAKDSPLLIDCPSAKHAKLSSTHSGLDAAINKFRMTAYMWQAFTAEDLRLKGLGRRAFRLEEEWTSDKSTRQGHHASSPSMKAVPKVHLIRSDLTVAELRNANFAQQNQSANQPDKLHELFTQALAAHGVPFEAGSRPIVAGLILDSHYAPEQNLILGHAALGSHNRKGLSLGIFGSHLTYSWPRFIEEVAECLLDETEPGDQVGNDNKECETMRRACFVGQGAFMHEVGHAFGAAHTTGIMARGYSRDWGYNFLGQSKEDPDHEATWDLEDALRFLTLPHFRLPGDEPLSEKFLSAPINFRSLAATASSSSDDEADDKDTLVISSSAYLARVTLSDGTTNQVHDLMHNSALYPEFQTNAFDAFSPTKPLHVTALARNGVRSSIANLWTFFQDLPYIRVPNSTHTLHKQSVRASIPDDDSDPHASPPVPWTVLFETQLPDKTRVSATSIELRVGCTLDGAIVHYNSQHRANCGPNTDRHGNPFRFGGHASTTLPLPRSTRVKQIELNHADDGWCGINGIRVTLDNGTQSGELNASSPEHITALHPQEGHVIVGFYGSHHPPGRGFTREFGILTWPENTPLPDEVFDLPQIRTSGQVVVS